MVMNTINSPSAPSAYERRIHPKPETKKPREMIRGKKLGDGIWIEPSGSAGSTFRPDTLAEKNSSYSFTKGSWAKLYSGTGEGVVHSSVRPSQGSAPATSPRIEVTTTLYSRTRTPAAMKKAPMVLTRLKVSSPSPGR